MQVAGCLQLVRADRGGRQQVHAAACCEDGAIVAPAERHREAGGGVVTNVDMRGVDAAPAKLVQQQPAAGVVADDADECRLSGQGGQHRRRGWPPSRRR